MDSAADNERPNLLSAPATAVEDYSSAKGRGFKSLRARCISMDIIKIDWKAILMYSKVSNLVEWLDKIKLLKCGIGLT